ncbi:MAG TPA: NAD(P)/FAD-dependent oxidoreductase [Chryseolinea sp.]|nr:NAD(P)/FAD-dependent oxidoreductase [Chryseolinea sp.]
MVKFDLIVIGGGAAGFFGAIQAASMKPGLRVLILEKSSKLLSKVRVSGGGRCNVTHNCFNPSELARHYPRGEKALKSLFKSFDAEDIVGWFHSNGVSLKTENDGRMFPTTDRSETIIECFLNETERLKINIKMNTPVTSIARDAEMLIVSTRGEEQYQSEKVLVAIGGHANPEAYQWLVATGHSLKKPIPSLFTFNDTHKKFTDLMGISVPDATVRIAGTKFTERGPVLITHWGLSGPAVIKLSAWAAEYLHDANYLFTVMVNWTGSIQEEMLRKQLTEFKAQRGKLKIVSNPLFNVPTRLWQRLCSLSEINDVKIWSELANKSMNRLIEYLVRCPFEIKGKTTFKEEFVTCGGIDLQNVNLVTMESKVVRNVYFAGEVLDVDGETGGFNFQSAWTTAYVAAKSMMQ